MKKSSPESSMHLAGAPIVIAKDAPATIRLAAGELARYLHLLTGKVSPLRPQLPARGTALVLDRRLAAGLGVKADAKLVGDQGYRLAAVAAAGRRCLIITATQPVGILYGVYGLLEELGMGFYAGGDTFPELPTTAVVPADLDLAAKPAFKVRGNMLHYNFLCGCTNWGLADYKFYFDQLARMRGNLLLMHWYDGEPGAAYEVDGEYLAGGGTPNSLTKPWGALAALRTSQFSFGTGRFFNAEIYSSPMGEDQPDLLTEVKRSEAMFYEATAYARQAGIGIAAGFEAPRGDPTDPQVQKLFQCRVHQFLERNPDLSHFALWEHESGGCVGSEPPPAGSAGARLMEKRRKHFYHVGNEQRVWEAVRFGRFAELALTAMAKIRPDLPLVLVGWGGDRWMQFADYCLGYDKFLPANVIFTCHDNIDASMGPNVSSPWGKLPPERERWAMPWVEGDIDDCAVRQPHVESLGKLAPDALAKGCQGLLTLQWRTRDVEEETGYVIRFAWQPGLTPEEFYQDMARRAFGPDQEKTMGAHLGTLQKLGARWAGVRGTAECSRMRWTGWVPHFPFELDDKTAAYLLPLVEKIIAALAEVPQTKDSEAAFHLLPDGSRKQDTKVDRNRFGVKEMETVKGWLEQIAAHCPAPGCLRHALENIEEEVYDLRPLLVAYGMTGRCYQAIDGFLIAIHHLHRNAGATERRKILHGIRADLDVLRQQYLKQKRLPRLERLEYLAATIDFALDFNAAVMLLADGEMVEQALTMAQQAKDAGDETKAAAIAAQAYADLVPAGMQSALLAFTRKLTTRCDFGTLTTLNVKPLPLYWDTIGRLEAFLPAVPPRELQAVGKMDEVWLSWEPGPRCTGQNLYRRPAYSKSWKRVNARPLGAECRMFIDRPAKPGAYEYAVTALANDNWESPHSHTAQAECGPLSAGPRIVACKPISRTTAGVDFPLQVTVLSDRGLREVSVCWRQAGDTDWWGEPLVHGFRKSYTGAIPGAAIKTGFLEFFIMAVDGDGNQSVWPESAPTLPWSATVLPAQG